MTSQTHSITARIYWDDQDPKTVGWAWANRVDGEHDDTGPLGDGYPAGDERLEDLEDMDDADLIDLYHREVNTQVTDIEIVR